MSSRPSDSPNRGTMSVPLTQAPRDHHRVITSPSHPTPNPTDSSLRISDSLTLTPSNAPLPSVSCRAPLHVDRKDPEGLVVTYSGRSTDVTP